MDFQAFEKTDLNQYAEEVKERWGSTAAYQEYRQKTLHSTPQEQEETGARLLTLLSDLGALRPLSPADPAVQEKVKVLQDFITAHYYTCTDEIFSGLGQMYVSDDRMRANIDRAGGEGTAEFVRQAIDAYRKAKK